MKNSLLRIFWIFRRETTGYFTSPLAYVFIVIFLLLCSFFTFTKWFGGFFAANEASLANCFFPFHPWLYLLLVPAVAMRLWAEENKSGTIELLFTMPISTAEAVAGKYLAAWFVLGLSLLLTFPLAITVLALGEPDIGTMISGYLASLLLAGTYLAIGSFTSAISKNQVVSFIICLVICLSLLLIGHPAVTDYFTSWAPEWIVNLISGASVISHYEGLRRGVIDVKDISYFLSTIVFALCATGVALNSRRSS
jgi:ABC-2 type transport system permease protein